MSAADFLPESLTLRSLQQAAASCRGCGLWRDATQTVFGEGLKRATLVLVGEQPGDREDREGAPFVGPAGLVLDRALEEAGIDRGEAYVTNVVKHFKFERRGKRRIHKRPAAEEIRACRPWLEAELSVVRPRALVCLGATAARALLGPDVWVFRDRGRLVDTDLAPMATATVHPSSILRAPDDRTRRAETRAFVEDFREVARHLAEMR